MKKFILVGLILSSNIGFCPGDAEMDLPELTVLPKVESWPKAKKSILRRSSAASSETEKQNFIINADIASKKRTTEDVELDRSLAKDLEAKDYLQRRTSEYAQNSRKMNQRNRAALVRRWDESLDKDKQRAKAKISFGSDVVDRGPFNSLDVDTWDLNRLKKIKPEVIGHLSEIQVAKLLNKPDYLKDLKGAQLQAIAPTMFLKVLSEEEIRNILNDTGINFKFNKEQILAMNFRIHLDSFNVAQLKLLLNKPDFLQALDQDQIRQINPEILSQALYYALPEKLPKEFFEKLSDQQIIQLFNDHIEWGFHNLRTSFKLNLSSEALEYMQQRAHGILNEEATGKLIGG
jgi:hypothetical protein